MLEQLLELLIKPETYCLASIIVTIILFVIQLIVFKRFSFIQVLAFSALVLLSIFIPISHLAISIIFAIFYVALAGYGIYDFVVGYHLYGVFEKEINNFLKNNEFDFFVQTNHKDKIINFSNQLLKITKMPKQDIKGVYCWKLLVDYLKVTKINKKEVNLSSIEEFLSSFKEANSKHIIYNFEFEMPKIDDLTNDKKEELTTRYIGLIQPVYYKKTLVGRNIYFYQDRMQVLNDLRKALEQATIDLQTAYNFGYIAMSLTDYVGLYFDYNTRTYVATEAFMKFTRTHQKEYTFEQFLEMMHPDDVDRYIEQSETINSVSVTKIKYRLLINDEYYNVLEDSININKDADLLSIIRIINKTDEVVTRDIPFSNQEAENVLDDLSAVDIDSIMNDTESILNTVIGKDEKN